MFNLTNVIMKKIFLVAAMMVSSVAMFAQHAVGSFSIQPKIGMNIATLTKADGADPRIGLVAGAEVEYQVTDIFSISGGALYSMQGAKSNEEEGDATIKLDYINIPILANVYVAKGLAVKLGIQPGFNVKSKLKVESGDYSGEVELNDVKDVDFSMPVGLSYEYKNFVIDGRYNWGLTKLVDGESGKNSVFQFTLGYKFEL